MRFLSDYRGDQIPAGKKSVAFAVAFQSPERTLSDEDATRLRGAVVERARGALRRRAARLTRGGRFGALQPGSDPGRVRSGHVSGDKSANFSSGRRLDLPTSPLPSKAMPRDLRLEAPDVLYHVGSRGVEKRQIFDCAHRRPRVLPRAAREGRPEVRLASPRLLLDGEPLPPGPRHSEREPLGGNAVPEGAVRAVVQRRCRARGSALRAPLLVADRAQRGLRARALALRRPQSRPSGIGKASGRMAVEQLSGNRRASMGCPSSSRSTACSISSAAVAPGCVRYAQFVGEAIGRPSSDEPYLVQ